MPINFEGCINTIEDRDPARSTPSKRLQGALSMCIYCTTNNYRKIYENHKGPIPYDQEGRSYHIHHIDGNHNNNSLDNLKAVSLEEHYQIHYSQGDWAACVKLAAILNLTPDERKSISERVGQINKATQQRLVKEGKHHWLGGAKQTQRNHDWVKAGIHPFLGGDLQRKRAAEGTHPFLGGEIQRQSNARLLAEGRHNSQIRVQCCHCGKIASSPNIKRWHNDKCKSLKQKPECN